MTERSRADALLDVAEAMARQRGYFGFSFRDLAEAVGVKNPSVHHHFPKKEDLGRSLVERYTQRFLAELGDPDTLDPRTALNRYAAQFRASLTDDGKMCLCGMLGAETHALPASVSEKVTEFFTQNARWLTQVLERHSRDGSSVRAWAFLSTLEGAMLVSRSTNDLAQFDSTARWAVDAALAKSS